MCPIWEIKGCHPPASALHETPPYLLPIRFFFSFWSDPNPIYSLIPLKGRSNAKMLNMLIIMIIPCEKIKKKKNWWKVSNGQSIGVK